MAGVSLAEWRVLERLVLSDPAGTRFVVEAVRGIWAGTPVFEAWQHRLLPVAIVHGLGGANVGAVTRFSWLAVLGANVLLAGLAWRRSAPPDVALALRRTACWGLAHFVLAYKLEYPWDGIDVVLFLAFGHWARGGGSLRRAAPLLALGTLNHETILYMPMWYLASRERTTRHAALGAAAGIFAVVLGARAAFYRGRPDLPGQAFEPPLPVVGNPSHVVHNLEQLAFRNWGEGKWPLTLGFVGAVIAFGVLAMRAETRRAGAWSLLVLAAVFVFGYVNETRLYLPLAAFWTTYGLRESRRGSE